MGEKSKGTARSYTEEYKAQAVKLAREIGNGKAASELGIPIGTLYGWVSGAMRGRIDTGPGTQTPETAMTQAAEIQRLLAELKEKNKEIKEIRELNEFLEEAASFFAANRQKSKQKNASS